MRNNSGERDAGGHSFEAGSLSTAMAGPSGTFGSASTAGNKHPIEKRTLALHGSAREGLQ